MKSAYALQIVDLNPDTGHGAGDGCGGEDYPAVLADVPPEKQKTKENQEGFNAWVRRNNPGFYRLTPEVRDIVYDAWLDGFNSSVKDHETVIQKVDREVSSMQHDADIIHKAVADMIRD